MVTNLNSCFPADKVHTKIRCLLKKTKKCANRSQNWSSISQKQGKWPFKINVSIIYGCQNFHRFRNPTPDSSPLPKWVETKEFPVNYYRLGNLHFDNKPMFGMESGGIFEDRAAFWRQLYANLLNKKSANDEF